MLVVKFEILFLLDNVKNLKDCTTFFFWLFTIAVFYAMPANVKK